MNYKVVKEEQENEIYFRYMQKDTNKKKKPLLKYKKNDNPFNTLRNLNYNQN
jgi:hypothetical protein